MEANESTSIKILGTCRIDSPIASVLGERAMHFVGAAETIVIDHRSSAIAAKAKGGVKPAAFELAGPRNKIFFDPSKTRVGIVTCGGLCPGINNVIQGLVHQLIQGYGVKTVYGFRFGYQGFIAKYKRQVMDLNIQSVAGIHEIGGTILGSSRGHQDPVEIVDCLERMGISILFVIGGDGTIRGSMSIVDEIDRRGVKISVIGIPKTIDNDVMYTDKSFGFDTAYAKAVEVIRSAHVEAKGAPNGIGIVKLMGRHSGFIACHAALASRDANVVLIPEVPFKLEGENGLLNSVQRRIEQRGHAILVIAEGAGQEHLAQSDTQSGKDASGNSKLKDIALFVKDKLINHFLQKRCELNLKFIDPSYVIRSIPASPADAMYCRKLSRYAVHGAMAGNTRMLISLWHGEFVHIPMDLAVSSRKTVDPEGDLWMSVREATGQPARYE